VCNSYPFKEIKFIDESVGKIFGKCNEFGRRKFSTNNDFLHSLIPSLDINHLYHSHSSEETQFLYENSVPKTFLREKQITTIYYPI
jgi:hypothetical protein